MDQEEPEEDFFLPDICQAQSILLLVLIAELLVFVVVLANSRLIGFNWVQFGLASLFVQWIVLLSAAVLCNFRPLLMKMSVPLATVTGYGMILSVTLIFSLGVEWLTQTEEMAWSESSGNVVRNLIVAAVMAGMAFRYFFLQHQLRRQEQVELNSRIQALQSRIRPHFLFNSMNIIASLISIDPDTAEEVVEDLSVLFRASLNDSSDKPVLLEEELALCEKYVHIESLRLDDRLRVEWEIEVDETQVRIPLLTLQPLLENAIYHGIQPLPEGGVVSVHIGQKLDQLVVTITNPLPSSEFSYEEGNRMALDNISRRLNAIYGERTSLVAGARETTFQTIISYPLIES
ncbi:MAG: histidine kinase [Pseudomonadales bacterium]|nr:histidine kinase [Pseudomonadales bacterium]MDP6315030.1 histidine kinase [Pseudomonadales bacterium]MDP7315835.1 histidine kinase [Pseudomonadales bacterium]MDP7575651.1 histidine kinase [Pseudomonadales bacterium]